jgi:antitoxin VapB
MATAKIFMSGQDQAVCLPKEFHINADEVNIKKVGESIVLTPVKGEWDQFFAALDQIGDVDEIRRNQPPVQHGRESLDDDK